MGGRMGTIFMFVKFGDDRISSLDFSFIGGCTLKEIGIFGDPWNMKIGLSHALRTSKKSLYNEKKISGNE